MTDPARAARTEHPSQRLTLLIGALYALAGLAGFLVTGFEGFAEPTDHTLVGLGINPLHNLVHLGVGVAGLLIWRDLRKASWFGYGLAAVFGALFLYGIFAADRQEAWNFLSLNVSDNGLHLVTAVFGLLIAFLPRGEASLRT